jgi:AcrR family transcriptional regulator
MAPETLDAHDHGERALRALTAVVAEEGYANTTVDLVVKRAAMSPATFYSHFSGKEDAMTAAIASAGARISAAVMPAFRRNPDWPYAVRTAYGAFFNFLASRPALARLILVEAYAAGAAALHERSDALREVEGALIAEGLGHAPLASPIALEAVTGGIYALAYAQVRKHGVGSLAGLAPIATYFTLAPFVGTEHACEVANSDGRPRTDETESQARVSIERARAELMQQLATRVMSAAELASEVDRPEADVQADLDDLEQRRLVEPIDGPQNRYQSRLRRMGREWEELSRPERERISARIGNLISWEVRQAAQTGTFDRRPDRHLSRIAYPVDERGWQEMLDIHSRSLDALERVTAESVQRLKRSGEKPIHARSMQTLFEMPDEPDSADEE